MMKQGMTTKQRKKTEKNYWETADLKKCKLGILCMEKNIQDFSFFKCSYFLGTLKSLNMILQTAMDSEMKTLNITSSVFGILTLLIE